MPVFLITERFQQRLIICITNAQVLVVDCSQPTIFLYFNLIVGQRFDWVGGGVREKQRSYRIARELAHILQKSEGPLDFGSPPF